MRAHVDRHWPSPNIPCADGQVSVAGWALTGNIRERRRFLRAPVLEVEERGRVFRPIVTGYTPANWREERRFRRATVRDLLAIQAAGLRLEVASIFPPMNVDVPMPSGTRPPGSEQVVTRAFRKDEICRCFGVTCDVRVK